jgi:hypothetical protein
MAPVSIIFRTAKLRRGGPDVAREPVPNSRDNLGHPTRSASVVDRSLGSQNPLKYPNNLGSPCGRPLYGFGLTCDLLREATLFGGQGGLLKPQST